MPADPTTQANYDQIRIIHAALDWTVDFSRKVIAGSITHTLQSVQDAVCLVVFDTDDLQIDHVNVDDTPASFSVEERHPVMGSALHITLPSPLSAGQNVKIRIEYVTSSNCTALQWLDKEQTQGQQHPYLFSQCQPIYARGLAPLQDTPSVKFTYSALVTSPLPVLMSALRTTPPPANPVQEAAETSTTYAYEQPIPIPSYLLAIASGNVRYKVFPAIKDKAWNSGIWAEPELLDAAYWEFSADTDRFLKVAADALSPYRFKTYDLLVLPPSFPYGGMENACLSFLTPTLLAGDRTLVDVVVHELTHSWFGNGVTHTSATHFWLNEGWTTYIERVLQQLLHTPAHRGFSYLIGYKSLTDALKLYVTRPKYQRMVIDFETGEDPDDAYSSIPYEKGANLLLHLEALLGGLDVFLPYVKDYIDTFIGKSIDTTIWKDHLYQYWRTHGGNEKVKVLDSVDWNAWFYGEGLELPVKLKYDTTLAEQVYKLAQKWEESRSKDPTTVGFQKIDLDAFDTNQKIVFLERLQETGAFPARHVEYIGQLYAVRTTTNVEVRQRYYEFALLDTTVPEAKVLAQEAAEWVVGEDSSGMIKGRMKFCRPIFRAVNKVDAVLAKSTFRKHATSFHPIARRLIEKDLGLVKKT